MLSPVLDVGKAAMETFVGWCREYEWISSKSLFLVTPGEGLDGKALELADSVGLDAGTLKVCFVSSWVDGSGARDRLCEFCLPAAVRYSVGGVHTCFAFFYLNFSRMNV